MKTVENKRACFDYDIDEDFEAGIVLTGTEVKAARAGRASITSSFVRPLTSGPDNKSEMWLVNSHFAQVEDPDRSKKLLLHRKEIDRLIGKSAEKGLTLVPLRMYFTRGKVKILVGLGRGKKRHEKRETIKRRDVDRELRRTIIRPRS